MGIDMRVTTGLGFKLSEQQIVNHPDYKPWEQGLQEDYDGPEEFLWKLIADMENSERIPENVFEAVVGGSYMSGDLEYAISLGRHTHDYDMWNIPGGIIGLEHFTDVTQDELSGFYSLAGLFAPIGSFTDFRPFVSVLWS